MKSGQRLKIQMGLETDEERKKRVAREKKEIERSYEYFKRITKLKPKQENVMRYNTFKSVMWEEGKKYFKNMNRAFTVDENNEIFLKLISLYFSNDSQFEVVSDGELRKGLLIYGSCGVGKSSIFDIIQNISKKYSLNSIWFKNTSVHDVITEYNITGEEVVKKYTRGRVHFDDLGSEKIANSWGVREKLMGRILEIRYNQFKADGTKTFVTTNLSIEKLEAHYGQRVADRLYEMFNFIELKGGSRRF